MRSNVMYIKQQTFIPPEVKITRLPPSNKVVRSLYSLEREDERRLERQADKADMTKRFKEAIARGMSIADAAMYATR